MKQQKTQIKSVEEFVDKNYRVADIRFEYRGSTFPYPVKVFIKGRSQFGEEADLVIDL